MEIIKKSLSQCNDKTSVLSVIYTQVRKCSFSQRTISERSRIRMEDKRIVRTKQILKQTMINMLADSPFEQISIKQLCGLAGISRVTFYTHYNDKYDLAEDIFKDMQEKGRVEFFRLQSTNNPGDDPTLSYCNLLDCVLTIYYNNYDFFRHTLPDRNPYLSFSFYNYVMEIVETLTEKMSKSIKPKYSPRKITGFLCYGLCGFVNESRAAGCPVEDIRKETKEVLRGILDSGILTSYRTEPQRNLS